MTDSSVRPAPGCETLSCEDFQRLADLSFDAMVAHRDGRVVWLNKAAAQLAGVKDASELIGSAALDFVPEIDRPAVEAATTEALTTGRGHTSHHTFRRRTGEVFEAEAQRWPGSNGVMLLVLRDLESRLKAQRSQHSAELRAKAFFDASTEAMGMSRLGVHLEVNTAYARLFGYDDPADFVGMPLLDVMDEREHARIAEYVERRARGEPVPRTYTVFARRRDGTRFLMEVNVSSYQDHEGTMTIVVARDVSSQQAEEERRVHREKLEAIGRLAGGVAHDFNNLLTAILGNVELSLAYAGSDAPLRKSLTSIREASHRAADLVKQILAFGRRDQPPPRPIDLTQTVADALGLVRSLVPTTVDLETSVKPVPGTVLADATQVHQILLNLCSNARDAVDPGGHVRVSLEPVDGDGGLEELRHGRWARLRVADDGVGMDAATRARLFEPYHTTKADRGGHGLGLAVVHGIVTSLRALVQVQSEPGRGSTFDVYFPLSAQPVQAMPEQTPVAGGKERVLLVEDEPLVRNSVKRLLQSLGYGVTVASDGQEALTMYRAQPEAFDLVLSDISIPRVSGIQLARQLLAEQPTAKVILYTGFSDRIDEATSRELGIKGLLAKPISRDALAAAVREALGESLAASL